MELWQQLAATSYNREAKSGRTDWQQLAATSYNREAKSGRTDWQQLAATSYNCEAKSGRTDWQPPGWSRIFLNFFFEPKDQLPSIHVFTDVRHWTLSITRASKVSVILFSSPEVIVHDAHRVCVCARLCVSDLRCAPYPTCVLAPFRCVILIKQCHISEGHISIPFILLSGTTGLVWLRHAGQRSRSKPCIQNRYRQ